MSSKRLESILGSVPYATAKGEIDNSENRNSFKKENKARIVATIPQSLKDEIQSHIKNNKGETETIIVLRALKKLGFTVDDSWIVDRRTLR